ncbi:SDR family NAD(P)-dependent oxidoreductase [Nocardia flavorosea]|uniref:3-oxoacyl-[acyl-carrier-protein] reductase MabA n=1 Tax=Nocardia flavorosea TaxID=53429 RepID=A0A846YTY0_9NOCA|nr:SDR family oxidoreductase [Nocardia flavorosea]NKY60722.1 SDR family oxidoreductase [Nocardia flavorosea]
MRLDGRVAIVTGGAGGIGRGIVRAFIDEGASVVFADIDADAGHTLEQELGGRAKYVDIDIAQEGSAEKICAAAIETFGALHILVNNAHASRQAPLVETTQDMFDLSFGTGFYPTVRLMQAAYSHLRATAGTVINFASGAGIEGQATQASYAAAKEAIRAVSRVAANEWATDNITVNVISPLALTEGVQTYVEANPGVEEVMLKRVPLRRFGDPQQDIGRVAVFLASADAGYITGQTLMVDGGTVKLR